VNVTESKIKSYYVGYDIGFCHTYSSNKTFPFVVSMAAKQTVQVVQCTAGPTRLRVPAVPGKVLR